MEETKQQIDGEETVKQTTETDESVKEQDGEEKAPVKEEDKAKLNKPKYFKQFKNEEDWENYESILKERYDKELASKLNIDSVKDIQNIIEEKASLNKQLQQANDKIKTQYLDGEVLKYGISDEFKDDFLTLCKAKTVVAEGQDYEKAFDDIAKSISDKNKAWSRKGNQNKIVTQLGNIEKGKAKPVDDLDARLGNKYPWLKKK